MKKYLSRPGITTYGSVLALVEYVNRQDEAYSMDLNGVEVIARPGDGATQLHDKWRLKMNQEADNYRNSPQALAEAICLAAMQSRVDELMEQLGLLDFANLDELIAFFDELTKNSNDSSVVYDQSIIIDVFTRNGFVPVADIRLMYDEHDRENSARYLIGQALGCLMIGMPVHPVFCFKAEEWYDKFGKDNSSVSV